MAFATAGCPTSPDAIAPDGAEVRLLCRVAGGSMAHFRLPPGRVLEGGGAPHGRGALVRDAGEGELWRRGRGGEEVVALRPGVAVSIPVGTVFQFRAAADSEVAIVGVTMPPWPGDDEAVPAPWAPWRAKSVGATGS